MTDPLELGAVSTVATVQLGPSGRRERREEVAVEAPLTIMLAGEALAVTMRTPGHDEELTAGFLLAEGHGPRGEAAGQNVIRRGTLSSAACGVCGRDQIDDLIARLRPVQSSLRFRADVITGAMRRLPEHQPCFARTGGLHGAALLDAEGSFLLAREDVGRHNAVDKVLGRAALDGWLPLARHALAVSGRTSFEIVQKAVVAGIPAVLAISAPSSLAIDLAERFGLLLVGFARGDSFTVYAGHERLESAR